MFEDDEAREERTKRLKDVCEALGLVVSGFVVIAPLPKPVAVDASAIDPNNPVPALMYLAYRSGVDAGKSEVRGDLQRILCAPEME